MTLADAIKLIDCDSLHASHQQTWFDLGCGSGLFSEALNKLLPPGSSIYAIDKVFTSFVSNQIMFQQSDFEKDPLPNVAVNGVLMANSLHFVKDKLQFLNRIKTNLLPGGVFMLVEYDMETPNRWVPYPINFKLSKDLFNRAGFQSAIKVNETLSRFDNRTIYSSLFFNLEGNPLV